MRLPLLASVSFFAARRAADFFYFGIRSTVSELHDDIERSGRVNARQVF